MFCWQKNFNMAKRKAPTSFKEQFSALKNLPRFFSLIWKTSQSMTLANVFLRLFKSAIPLAMLWIGKEIIEEINPLYERISSHTARRSFITIMKNKKIPDKVIMSYTGHKSLEVFNKYYKPNDDDRKGFMKTVWNLKNTQLKKAE